jgi:predicted DNA-binding transcriptional regulator AlpA
MGTPARLAGLAEVAALLGISKRSASRYTRRDDFPAPVARLSTGPVWDAGAVEAWGAEHGPFRRGRPAKRE